MSSYFNVPGDIVWASNGTVIHIEECLIARTQMLGLEETPAGRALVAFLTIQLQMGGGMFGFDVTKKPFDDLECRRLLARLVADVAHEIVESAVAPSATWQFLHDEREPWRFAWWMAVVERLHDGIVRSFANRSDPAPALALALAEPLRAAVDVNHWWSVYRDARFAGRQNPAFVAEHYGADAELRALERLIAALPQLATTPAGSTPAGSTLPTLPTLLAERAQLLESAGRLREAAATWREIETMEPDRSVAEVAGAIAADLERRLL